MDVWGKLYDIASDNEPPAKIIVTDDPGEVVLEYPDGSRAGLHWNAGDWHFAETLNTAPGDVAARDSF